MTKTAQTTQPFDTPANCQPDAELTLTIRLLARLGRERFFGKVTINFQDGKIMLLHKEECIKPTELGR
jgi:hypothetical protein